MEGCESGGDFFFFFFFFGYRKTMCLNLMMRQCVIFSNWMCNYGYLSYFFNVEVRRGMIIEGNGTHFHKS